MYHLMVWGSWVMCTRLLLADTSRINRTYFFQSWLPPEKDYFLFLYCKIYDLDRMKVIEDLNYRKGELEKRGKGPHRLISGLEFALSGSRSPMVLRRGPHWNDQIFQIFAVFFKMGRKRTGFVRKCGGPWLFQALWGSFGPLLVAKCFKACFYKVFLWFFESEKHCEV